MITLILIVVAVITLIFLLVILALFFRRFFRNFDYITGYILDLKVDEIFRKSTIIAELYAREQKLSADEKRAKALERGTAIAADVLLINRLNPRDYHLEGLIKLQRYLLGFDK